MATVRSAMCILSGAGPSGGSSTSRQVFFTGRKRSGFYMDEASGLLQLVSTAEKKFV